jgi:transporter family protein
MQKATVALLIGGLLPAVLFGISGALQKTSARAGIGTGPYLIVIGLVVVTVGLLVTAIQGDRTINLQSALNTCAYGLFWSSGIMCIALALGRYDARISQLVPLYNMNTLVAVGLGLLVLGEWKEVNSWQLLLGAGLAVVGGVLAATSTNVE